MLVRQSAFLTLLGQTWSVAVQRLAGCVTDENYNLREYEILSQLKRVGKIDQLRNILLKYINMPLSLLFNNA